MSRADYCLIRGRLVLAESVFESGSVVVRDGRIHSVLPPAAPPPGDLPIIDAEGRFVTPGLFELHIHGAGGVGFDAVEAGRLRELARFLRGRGVSTFLPTLVADMDAVERLSRAIEEAGLPEADLPGIYLEGPFVSAAKRGGIPLDTLAESDTIRFQALRKATRGRLKLMTFAPELTGVDRLYAEAARAGVIPALGHSDCEISKVPLPPKPFSITHLFNAMSPFSHKDAGLAMLPFVDPEPYVELNADGVHVNPESLRAAARALNPERLILISDAVVAAGLPWGSYRYHGRDVVSGTDGVRYAEGGVLMGSNRLADDVLRNWLRVTGASIPAAVAALTRNPARILGLQDRRGGIEPGLEAELVLWDEGFENPRFAGDLGEDQR